MKDTIVQTNKALKKLEINNKSIDSVLTKTFSIDSNNILFLNIPKDVIKNKCLNEFGEHSFEFKKLEIE